MYALEAIDKVVIYMFVAVSQLIVLDIFENYFTFTYLKRLKIQVQGYNVAEVMAPVRSKNTKL